MNIQTTTDTLQPPQTQPTPLDLPMTPSLVGTVLVLEDDRIQLKALEKFCGANNLTAVTAHPGSVTGFLQLNADLSAVLLAEDYGGSVAESAVVARDIRSLRPELPIILRRQRGASLDGLPDDLGLACRAGYPTGDMRALGQAVARHVFTLNYPDALLAGITEITQQVLASEFCGFEIESQPPMVVHDRVVFGELFSLIPLESDWCRGYLMLQTDETRMLQLLDHSGADGAGADLRSVNDRLREATNLIWGLFKNRYVGDRNVRADSNVQVPLVFNLSDRCISFGASNAHVCFRYRLKDAARGLSIDLFERFVFNLSWSPDDFHEIAPPPDSGVGSGGLEFF